MIEIMRVLRDYILKEFFYSFLLSVAVFTFVLLVGNIITLADLIINKAVDIVSVLTLFFYMIPWLLSFTLPMAALTAVILTFGRFSSDGELTAMKASGISLFRISVPILVTGLLFGVVSFYLNDKISSNASFASRKIIKNIGMKKPTAYLEEGTFIRGLGEYVIFIHEIHGNKLKNIRVYQPQEGKATRTIVAESGEIKTMPEQNMVELTLYNGTSEEPSPTDSNSFYKLNFKTYNMTLDLSSVFKKEEINKKTRELTINELRSEIARCAQQGIGTSELWIELYQKVNMAIASFVLILIGIPLGIQAHRSEKSIGFGISLILFAIYWGTSLAGITISLQGFLPALWGVSLANILFFIGGTIIFIVTARR